jgi:hypothetical protein
LRLLSAGAKSSERMTLWSIKKANWCEARRIGPPHRDGNPIAPKVGAALA